MLGLTVEDWVAIRLTLTLALTVTLILLIVCIPLAAWLVRAHGGVRAVVASVVTLPLVLPPTVLGFYFLVLFSPQSEVSRWLAQWGVGLSPFSFTGLVVASCVYSLPFVLQPIYLAFLKMDRQWHEQAQLLGATPWQQFWHITRPAISQGLILAAVLGIAHTVGEFGVVLMIGGNIPGETQVAAIRVYEYLEMLDYAGAHRLSLVLVGFSFISLLGIYWFAPQLAWFHRQRRVS